MYFYKIIFNALDPHCTHANFLTTKYSYIIGHQSVNGKPVGGGGGWRTVGVGVLTICRTLEDYISG